MIKQLFFKAFIAIALIFSMCFFSYGQIPQPTAAATNMTSKYYRYIGYVGIDSGLFMPSRDSVFIPISGKPAITRRPQDQNIYYYDSTHSKWVELVNLPQLNDTLSSYVKIASQNPTATLTGGVTYEYHPAGTFNSTLNYSAGRLASGTNLGATQPIASIVVAGNSESVSSCSTPPCTITGTQSVTTTYNTNTTYQNIVTTTDSKTATASTSFIFYHKKYLGWSVTTTPTNSEILAAVYQDNNGGTVSLSTTLAQIGSARYLFYATTATVSSVFVNGFPSSFSFSLNNIQSVTNASGAAYNYYVTVSNNQIGNLSTTALVFQ